MSRAYKPSFSIQPEQSSMLRIPEAALWEFQRYFQGLVERPLLIVGFKDPPPLHPETTSHSLTECQRKIHTELALHHAPEQRFQRGDYRSLDN